MVELFWWLLDDWKGPLLVGKLVFFWFPLWNLEEQTGISGSKEFQLFSFVQYDVFFFFRKFMGVFFQQKNYQTTVLFSSTSSGKIYLRFCLRASMGGCVLPRLGHELADVGSINSYCFSYNWWMVIIFIVGVYIPIIRIPVIKGGMSLSPI